MLQPAPTQAAPIPHPTTASKPAWSASVPVEQGTIGPTIVIKGEVTGSEPLYIDGRVEGTIHFAEHRVTIGRHGNVTADINAKEVVIMGIVKGNVQCTDRLDIRAEGSLIGDVITRRITVEEGAVLRGRVEVQTHESVRETSQAPVLRPNETIIAEKTKAAAAGA